MIYDDEDDAVGISFITQKVTIALMAFHEGTLHPMTVEIKYDFDTSPKGLDHDLRLNVFNAKLARRKFIYWMEECLNGSIMVDDDSHAAYSINNLCNNIIILPHAVNGESLAVAIKAKLMALANGYLDIGTVEVSIEDSDNMSYVVVGDPLDVLPTDEEWIAAGYEFTKPWWMRDDESSQENIEGEESVEFGKFEDIREEMIVEESSSSKEPYSATIIRGVFGKPKDGE